MLSANVDLFGVKPKPLSFHITKRANDHVKQGDAVFLARDPISVTDNQFPAMLTNTFHILPFGASSMPYQIDVLMYRTHLGLQTRFIKPLNCWNNLFKPAESIVAKIVIGAKK
jgi:hypothetical protein